MGQVSRPMLIALGLTVALAAVWLVALRPKPAAVQDTPLAPVEAVPAAKQASAASDAANAKLQAASKAADRTSTGKAAAATPADPATADPTTRSSAEPVTPATPSDKGRGETSRERPILREIRQGKVVVMLFWSSAGAEDVATRRALRSLNRRRGKVKVHVVPIGRVGDYGSITRGVTIAQSPTTLIIGRGGKSRTIVGLTEREELGQLVADAVAGR